MKFSSDRVLHYNNITVGYIWLISQPTIFFIWVEIEGRFFQNIGCKVNRRTAGIEHVFWIFTQLFYYFLCTFITNQVYVCKLCVCVANFFIYASGNFSALYMY